MVEMTVRGENLLLDVQGWDRLWSFKSRLEVPLRNIRGVKADSSLSSNPQGWRILGTYVPRLITAGTFLKQSQLQFWDVHNASNAIIIDLVNERYAQLVVEVANPQTAIKQIELATS